MYVLVLVLSIFLAISVTLLVIISKSKKADRVSALNQITKNIVNTKDSSALNYQLQAHERLVLLIERVYPPSLSLKLYNKNLTVKEMQFMITESINKEYEHNVTQQIYVNTKVWNSLKTVKENHLLVVNLIADKFCNEASVEFVKKIIEYYDKDEIKEQHNLLLEALSNEAKIIINKYQQL